MKRPTHPVPVAVVVLAVLSLACTVPLPAAELTATAESRPGPAAEGRGAGGVQAASSGPLRRGDATELNAVLEAKVEETAAPTATATPAPAPPTPTPEPAVQPENYPAETLAALNAARVERGLAPLILDPALATAAASYARYMGQANFFGHGAPDGSTPQTRIAAAGFRGLYKGEALSAGQPSPAAALQALLASPQHAAILLSSGSVAVGVGYYYAPASYYKHYWVVLTANP